MFDAILSASQTVLAPTYLMFVFLGVLLGAVVGIVPGIGGLTGAALLIPFLVGMDPYTGTAMFIGMMVVNQTTDMFPAVLIGVPGSAGSQATVLDGYPLSKRGEGERALGAGLSASLLGGLISAFFLLVIIFAAQPLIRYVGSPELLMLTALGLVSVGVLVQGDRVLGLCSALFGVMVATVGAAPAYPEYRFVFDQLYLYSGLPLVPITLGLFAVPEILELLILRTSVARQKSEPGQLLRGFRETLQHKWLVFRSSTVGMAIGAVPGASGAIVEFIAYALAKQSAGKDGTFGSGDIRGVIAPGSADNAKEGGTLIPTLVLGVPGSGTSAILMAALLMWGIFPGPEMLGPHLNLTLTIAWALVLANVFATILCFCLCRWMVRLTFVPGQWLSPFLIVIFTAAAFTASRHVGDFLVLLVFGVVGFVMKLVKWPRVPFLIGFVLAISFERYLHLSISRYGFTWLGHRTVIVIGCVILALLFWPPIADQIRKRRAAAKA